MLAENPPRKVEGAESVLLRCCEDKGRYLTAVRELKAGTVIISEQAFAEIPICQTKDHRFCWNCLKDIKSQMISCHGCHNSLHCSPKCKLSSWKCHHWIECFMRDLLTKICPETKLALRALLQAAYMFSRENVAVDHTPLENIAKDLSGTASKSCNLDKLTYHKNYWDIYCLQRHETEPSVERDFDLMYRDIQILTNALLNCFTMHDKLMESEKNIETVSARDCQTTLLLLQSLFKKMSFISYHSNDKFDIRKWKLHVEECCKSSLKIGKLKSQSLSEIFLQHPSSEGELLERLLLHHALQVRTNGQAVFRICESKERSRVQNTAQARIATGFFPVTSLMNHSCSPNTSISFNGRNIMVVASRLIKKGEEICHCYGPHYSRHSVEERQQMLKEQYFFSCKCTSCVDDLTDAEKASFNLQFHAFKCNYCGEPLKPDKSKNIPSCAICINEECKKRQDTTQHLGTYIGLMAMFEEACTLVDCGLVKEALEKLKGYLTVAEDVLYCNHVDIAKLHDKIAQCYVFLEDYTGATPHLSKSISIIGMLHGTQSLEIAHEQQKLASLFFNQRNVQQAGRIARRVISIYKINYHEEEFFPPGSEEMKKIIEISEEL